MNCKGYIILMSSRDFIKIIFRDGWKNYQVANLTQLNQLNGDLKLVMSNNYIYNKNIIIIRPEKWDRFNLSNNCEVESMCKLINGLPNISAEFKLV